ncbi:MAG: hypothetical protein FWH33_06090 [Oscillospiraceae bacterium]|nr:hypothetical protein [Oscillospiraceae bacterium]
MKKRRTMITIPAIILLVALFIFIQPLQTFAVDALSIFRVQDVHAINITIADIDHIAQTLQTYEPLISAMTGGKNADAAAFRDDAKKDIESMDVSTLAEDVLIMLDDPADFTAFDLKLPRDLRSQTPQIAMVTSTSQTITISPDKINAILSYIGATPLPAYADGAKITIITPAAAIIEYNENLLIATQMPLAQGDAQILHALSESLLSLPLWTEDLREQLSGIDLTSGIAYVPVIEGFGQRVTIGGSFGYIYTASDLEALLGSLGLSPSANESSAPSVIDNMLEESSVLVWAKDGVLYILAGSQPTGELTSIARSVR